MENWQRVMRILAIIVLFESVIEVIDWQRPRGGNRFWPERDHDGGFAPPPPHWPFRKP